MLLFLSLLCAQQSLSARLAGTDAESSGIVPAKGNDAPWFCRGSPCPPFEVIRKEQTYEVREYSKTTWISTVVESSNYEVAVAKGFVPLYNYLRGANDKQLQLDMAKPAIIDIRPNKDFSSTGTNYTVLFYLPDLSEETAPKPTSKDVRVVTSPKQRFYVYGFGGFATGGSILNSALKLALALKTDKQSFEPDHLWSALYDAPTRLFGRHNEVMFSASDKSLAKSL
ncbi:g13035 [Coccomyxa viridis]|uniref:G13035 protein n=1 Tax=Coccomyxa viridis TaxID=1274662 RepID=A0ABP1GBT2_9CHLO